MPQFAIPSHGPYGIKKLGCASNACSSSRLLATFVRMPSLLSGGKLPMFPQFSRHFFPPLEISIYVLRSFPVSSANQTTNTAKCATMGSNQPLCGACRRGDFPVGVPDFRLAEDVHSPSFCMRLLKDRISRVLLTQEVLGWLWLLHAQLCSNSGSQATG